MNLASSHILWRMTRRRRWLGYRRLGKSSWSRKGKKRQGRWGDLKFSWIRVKCSREFKSSLRRRELILLFRVLWADQEKVVRYCVWMMSLCLLWGAFLIWSWGVRLALPRIQLYYHNNSLSILFTFLEYGHFSLQHTLLPAISLISSLHPLGVQEGQQSTFQFVWANLRSFKTISIIHHWNRTLLFHCLLNPNWIIHLQNIFAAAQTRHLISMQTK